MFKVEAIVTINETEYTVYSKVITEDLIDTKALALAEFIKEVYSDRLELTDQDSIIDVLLGAMRVINDG